MVPSSRAVSAWDEWFELFRSGKRNVAYGHFETPEGAKPRSSSSKYDRNETFGGQKARNWQFDLASRPKWRDLKFAPMYGKSLKYDYLPTGSSGD